MFTNVLTTAIDLIKMPFVLLGIAGAKVFRLRNLASKLVIAFSNEDSKYVIAAFAILVSLASLAITIYSAFAIHWSFAVLVYWTSGSFVGYGFEPLKEAMQAKKGLIDPWNT